VRSIKYYIYQTLNILYGRKNNDADNDSHHDTG
jgi:hypothetical protein